MQNSSIQVVGVQVVNAFTACRCLLLVVNVDLGMSFHDLCDASSQVLQQSHEVIDLILLHQSNALALIKLANAIHEHFHELCLHQPIIRVDSHDVLSPFPCKTHEAIFTMIALHGDLQEERIGHLWCCDGMQWINTECLQCGNAEVFECISHESHIEYNV